VAGPTTYVALLRGINLGPTNRVSMAALRGALAARGLENPRTHLQSGNVILVSAERPAAVAAAVEACVADDLGVPAKVVVRTAKELAAAVDADPLTEVADDPAKHFIAFLSAAPPKAAVRALLELELGDERLAFGRREAYLWCPRGLRASKLGRLDLDERLGVTATMRNARTVGRLLELAEGEASPG
jgi:uncharacterized protein (DUF1697 family)